MIDREKARVRKARWAKLPCPRCGGVRERRARLCRSCSHAEVQAAALQRAHGMLQMRRDGLTNVEIGRRLGISRHNVGTVINRLKRSGVEVPPSPYDHHKGRTK